MIVYVGQTRMLLKDRLGSNGYARIFGYNTLARQPGRRNGGQETNCRVNALSNSVLCAGGELVIWYRVTDTAGADVAERDRMRKFGVPYWNRRIEA